MNTYSPEAALLSAWKKRLHSVPTRRLQFKRELIGLLENNDLPVEQRINEFERRRATLLSDEHKQGWTWSPHLTRFINTVLFFMPTSWPRPFRGSKLRQALSDPIKIENTELTYENFCKSSMLLIDNNAFEEALFNSPEHTLEDIKYRLENAPINDEEIHILCERIYAVKLLVSPKLYQYFLEKIYENYPQQSVNFFYRLFEKYDDEINPHNYIEHHMLALCLMKKFVKHQTDFNLRYYTQITLFILASLIGIDEINELFKNDTLKQDPLKFLLISWKNSSITDLYSHLHPFLKEVSPNEINAFSEDNLLTNLINLFRIFPIKKNPLLFHLAQQITEELFKSSYTLDPNFNEEHNKIDTLVDFFTTTIFCNTHLSSFQNKKCELQEEILNPMHVNYIPESLRLAEKYSIHLLLGNAVGINLFTERLYRLRADSYTPFPQELLEWISMRIKEVDSNLIPMLEHILSKMIIYDLPDAIKLPVATVDVTTEQLIDNIIQAIESAPLERSKENEVIKHVISQVNQLLSLSNLSSSQLETFNNEILFRLNHHYITSTLGEHWRKKINATQRQLCQLTMQDVISVPIEKFDFLIQARKHFENARTAHTASHIVKFVYEKEEATLALFYFKQSLEEPEKTQLKEALNFLDNFHIYLTDATYKELKNKLTHLIQIQNPSKVREKSFFTKSNQSENSGGRHPETSLLINQIKN